MLGAALVLRPALRSGGIDHVWLGVLRLREWCRGAEPERRLEALLRDLRRGS